MIGFSAVANTLHALGAVVWVGGMFFAHMALRPSVAVLDPPQRLNLWAEVFPRFFAWVWVAVITLNASGFGTVFVDFGGFASAGVYVHAMAGTGVLMSLIFAYIFFVPYRAFRARVGVSDWPAAAAAQAAIRRLVATNLVLGLVTVVLGAGGRLME
ncbi:MAG: CopD family protein [Hyphomicrobiales bacterium]|nr:CopD family protein [Hyphomicrobiales bacterium]